MENENSFFVAIVRKVMSTWFRFAIVLYCKAISRKFHRRKEGNPHLFQ